ncbi:MAG: hypothetical protein IT306_14625 [Chloroflexi bacterium]|nr:hypothetical protein [Chloroflexota bacterium]
MSGGTWLDLLIYSLCAVLVIVVGSALADWYQISAGYVALGGFLLGVAFALALWPVAVEQGQ